MNTAPTPPTSRVTAIDAYRGLVMFLMMAEVLQLSRMARTFPDSPIWQFLGKHQSHVDWTGCHLHDLIQPSFSFLVGVALPFSLASRAVRGQRFVVQALHAAWRALLLVALGIFLRSIGAKQTNFTFEDTLTQIGLGYFFLFLLGFVRPVWQWLAFAVVVVGYWAAFALYPLPGPGFDTRTVGVPMDWAHHFTGFAAHWDKNTNLAMAFDQWFLNLFPRARPFAYNGGGYATLSFIPTLGTMILGLIAGGWLKRDGLPGPKVGLFVVAGAVFLAAGWAAQEYGVCPIVKRIWTPAWTLYSGGWCFLLLAGFYATTDAMRRRAWAFPLVVIGANSIAAYCMAHLIHGFIVSSFKTHLGQDVFQTFGTAYTPFVTGVAVLAAYWLILFGMYRWKIFLRI